MSKRKRKISEPISPSTTAAARPAAKAPAWPSTAWRTWRLPAATLIVATFLACRPSLHNGFVFDDEGLVTGNPCVIASDALHRIWFSTDNYEYLPLTYTGFWLEYRLWGTNALGYHVVSVGLHALNV